MISESITLEAPFFDVDSCFVVWHGNYLKYFEQVRCKLLDTIGYNYKAMAASGYNFPVVDLHIKYLKPVTFGQIIKVTASLKEWENKLIIHYLVCDSADATLLTKGETVQVAVDVRSGLLQFETPQVLQDKVQHLLKMAAM